MVEVFRELPSKPVSSTPNCSLARGVIRYVIPSPICWSLGRIPPTQPSPASPLPIGRKGLVFYLARAVVLWLGAVVVVKGSIIPRVQRDELASQRDIGGFQVGERLHERKKAHIL